LEIVVLNGVLHINSTTEPISIITDGSGPTAFTRTINQLNDLLSLLSFEAFDSPGSIIFRLTTTDTQLEQIATIDILLPSPIETLSTIPTPSIEQSPPLSELPTKEPPIPTPTEINPGDEVKCTDADSCSEIIIDSLRDQGVEPCTDISDPCGNKDDCFDSSDGGATSSCKPAADYKVVITKETAKKEQEITVLSTTVRSEDILL